MSATLQPPVFRFAPSPNGQMHLGHALSALINLRLTRKLNGKILLRIEDIDTARCTPEFEKQMLEDLEWIGFEWDEPPLRQSGQFEKYRETTRRLISEGFVYPARLSRGEIQRMIAETQTGIAQWPRDPDGSFHYPGLERELDDRSKQKIIENKTSYALRLDTVKACKWLKSVFSWTEFFPGFSKVSADAKIWGDVILARKDIPASYHLCSVLDDASQNVTHVVRGSDLFNATAIHRLLQTLLGLPEPLYHHHELVLDDSGRKLSKSMKSSGVRNLRNQGFTPAQVEELAFSMIDMGLYKSLSKS